MTTIHLVAESPLAPERVLTAGHDFSDRRPEIFPAVSTKYVEIHESDQTSAGVTEGTRAAIGVNWSAAATTGRSPTR